VPCTIVVAARRAPHVGRRDAGDLRLCRSEADLNLRHEHLRLHLEVGHAVHARDRRRHLRALLAEAVEVGAEDPHDDRRRRAGEHLFHTLAKIREQVALQPGVSVDDRLHFRDGRFVVDVPVERDPQLCEIDADHFVGRFRAADMGHRS
jgi:hypothetical protein